MYSLSAKVIVLGIAGLSVACGRSDNRSSVGSEPPQPHAQTASELRAEALSTLDAEGDARDGSGSPERVALADLGLRVPSFVPSSGVCETIEASDIVRPGETGLRFLVGPRASPERVIRVIWSGGGDLVAYQDISMKGGYSVLVSDGKAVVQHDGKVATAPAADVLNAPDLGAPAQTAAAVSNRCR